MCAKSAIKTLSAETIGNALRLGAKAAAVIRVAPGANPPWATEDRLLTGLVSALAAHFAELVSASIFKRRAGHGPSPALFTLDHRQQRGRHSLPAHTH